MHGPEDEIQWLVAQLSALPAGQRQPCRSVDAHAMSILDRVIAARARIETTGHDLAAGTPVEKSPGVVEELRALKRAAKTGSNRVFMNAWASCGNRTRQLVWPSDVARTDIKAGRCHAWVSPPGARLLVINAPRCADAMPLIDQAIETVRSEPASERRRRQPDPLISELIECIAAAFEDISGRQAKPPFWRPVDGHWDGPFFQLCCRIDEHFALKNTLSGRRLRSVIARRSLLATR
jgi:hypothetical protein